MAEGGLLKLGSLSISNRSYSKNLEEVERTLARRTKAFAKDPSADNVHDLRTATRRMLAAFQLLPGKIRRRKKSAEHAANHQKLMKLDAKVRDLDIILSKISGHAGEIGDSRVVESLRKARASGVKPARHFASSIKGQPGLRIQARDLSDSALESRLVKTTGKLFSKIERRLPITLKDPEKKEELHLLREDVRRLRYVVEAAQTPKSTKTLAVLTAWQEILGAIHDSDVFIARLQDEKSPEVQEMVGEETDRRNQNYEKFRSMAKEEPLSRLTK